MPEDTLGPDTLSTRGIPTSRRGYDRKVVDAVVADAVAAWGALEKRHRDLVVEIERSGGLEHLSRDLGAIAADVAKILSAATEAADGIRSRAAADAERIAHESAAAAGRRLAEADADAARILTGADRQAFGIRRDAWDAGMDLLGGVQKTVAEVLAAAEDEAQRIRADAEKENHRRLVSTRREADEIVRNAKFEADRQLTMARDLGQEMLDRVQGSGATVIPTAAENHRRREIMGDIERLRAERTIEEVAVLPAEPAPTPEDSPEVLFGVLDPQASDLSDALAAEVGRLRGDQPPAKHPRGRRMGLPSSGPVADAATGEEFRPAGSDEVRTLFDALRVTAEHEPAAPEFPRDPMELRDRLVLPLHNQGLRDVKRRIVDLQNAALDALRAGRAWAPDQESIGAELAPAMEPVIQKSAAAGAQAAGVLGGVAGARPKTGDRPYALGRGMAADLASELRSALGAGGGPAEVSATVSRVFRAWRGDEAERWVRSIMYAAYHDSLVDALALGAVERVAGVGSGRPCRSCPGPDGIAWIPGEPPPQGVRVPPVDLDCVCTVKVVGSG